MSIISRGLRRVQRNRTFTFVGSVTSALSTIDISGTGRQAGDIGVLFDFARSGGGPEPSAVTPSGHTQASTAGDGSFGRVSITYKILTGSEASLTGMNGSSQNRKTYLVFRPTVSVSTVTYTAGGAEMTNGNPTLQTVDPSAETTAVILVGQMVSQSSVGTRSISPNDMNEVANSTFQYAHYLISNSSPASHTYDKGDDGNNNGLQSGYFEFT